MNNILITKTNEGIRSIGGFVNALSDERKKFNDRISNFLGKMPYKNSKKTKEYIELVNRSVFYFDNFLEALEINAGKNVSKLETYIELLQELILIEAEEN